MAYQGTILEVRWHRGFGVIEWEVPNASAREITFSSRELKTGGVQDLLRLPQVTFDVVQERAVRVHVIGVRTLHGTITGYGHDANTWIITEDRTNTRLDMQYDNIFKALPPLITPDERVSFTRDSHGLEALNIRFPDLASVSGVITSYSPHNGKGSVTPDGWGETVLFHKNAFTTEPSIRIGMRVKFGLERACPKKLVASGNMHAIQASWMRADVPAIQEVEHPDLPSQAEQPAASSVHLQPGPIIDDEGVPLDDRDSFNPGSHSLASESPLKLIQCTFSRDPEPFHVIMQDLMRERDGVRLRSGAYLFAHPFNRTVREFVDEAAVTSSKDVILTADLEDVVKAAVKNVPRRFRVHEPRCQPLVPDTWEAWEDFVEEQVPWEGESADQIDIMMIKRTFIHVPIPSSLLSAPSGGPRTNSDVPLTARFATHIAANPRRMVRWNPASSSF